MQLIEQEDREQLGILHQQIHELNTNKFLNLILATKTHVTTLRKTLTEVQQLWCDTKQLMSKFWCVEDMPMETRQHAYETLRLKNEQFRRKLHHQSDKLLLSADGMEGHDRRHLLGYFYSLSKEIRKYTDALMRLEEMVR